MATRSTKKTSGNPPPESPESGQVKVIPLVALRETVIFPEMIVPLQVGRDKSVQALNRAVAESSPIALVTQRQADREDINDPSELYDDRHAGQDRPGRAAPGRHRACHRPGPAAPARARLRVDGSVHLGPHRGDHQRGQRGHRGPGAGRSVPGADRAVRPVGRPRSRRRRPSRRATSPSRACWPTWSPTART